MNKSKGNLMDQKEALLALLRNPNDMVGTVQWLERNIHHIAFTLYLAKEGLVNWCLEELARMSPYVSAEAHFGGQTLEIKCLFPDIDYSRLNWRDRPMDRVLAFAAIEQARAKLTKLLGSPNNVSASSTS